MIPLALFLLACAAVYVGTIQAAFTLVIRLSFRLLAERNGRQDLLSRYLEDPFLLFVPTRLLLGLIFMTATVLVMMLGGGPTVHAASIVVIGMVLFIVLCQHVVPLMIVRTNPERILNLLLPSFNAVAGPLRPLTTLLFGATQIREHDTRPGAADETIARQAGPSDADDRHGLNAKEERRLLQSIFDFTDTLVREVMTPRPDIVAIAEGTTLEALLALFQEQQYSRIPVYTQNLDDIIGVVFVKDLIGLTDAGGEARPVTSLMRPPYFVPETKRVADLLREFQVRQVQSAIVVDEYGGTAGLVTLEDLLEEIVGEIRDEYDVEVESVVDEGNGSFLFSGMVDIDDVADRLNTQIERQGFETVGGYLLAHIGRVPVVGESFTLDGLHIEVVEAERRRVTRVRIRPQNSPATAPNTPGPASPP